MSHHNLSPIWSATKAAALYGAFDFSTQNQSFNSENISNRPDIATHKARKLRFAKKAVCLIYIGLLLVAVIFAP